MSEVDRWWEKKTPLYAAGDGQNWRKIYVRWDASGQWEYLMVITTDDDELVETVSMKSGCVDWEDHW